MNDIDKLRELLTSACEFAISMGLRIRPDSYGCVESSSIVMPDGSGCCCPVGALRLLTKKCLRQIEQELGEDAYAFMDGFDGQGHEFDFEGSPHKTAVRNLGIEFRKKYCPLGLPAGA